MTTGNVKICYIGDPHFQVNAYEECEELIEKCLSLVKKLAPTRIVLLGDVLDTHETAKTAPYKQACRFIEELSRVAPLDVLMGNHDLKDHNQFLSDNHFFNPLKLWAPVGRVTIVDRPMYRKIGKYTYGYCPYVPPDRFLEALDEFPLKDKVDWRKFKSIACHEEIKGCDYDGVISTKGAEWPPSGDSPKGYPLLISGHIHKPQTLPGGVYYPGSSRQVKANESPDKKIWLITYEDNGKNKIQKYSLGLKTKIEVKLEYDNIPSFDFTLPEKHHVKLTVISTYPQFKAFRKGDMYSKLVRYGVKVGHSPSTTDEDGDAEENEDGDVVRASYTDYTFYDILDDVMSKKPSEVREVYDELYG